VRKILGIAALVAALAPAAAVKASPAPRLLNANATSSNWAGYVASASGQSFTDVKGTWTQPTLTCTSTAAYSSFWVGLGGASGGSGLEQIGTSADCQTGAPAYSSWWEILPATSTPIPFTPAPGDSIAGEVSVAGTSVTMTLTDTTSGATFSKTVTVATPDTSSADWIAEAPSMCTRTCSVLPLASFGTTSFSAASATLGTTAGPISQAGFGSYSLDLRSHGGASATTSALGTDGASFTVTAVPAPAAPAPARRLVPKTPRVTWWRPRHWHR
jgi:Peptidase A4 family